MKLYISILTTYILQWILLNNNAYAQTIILKYDKAGNRISKDVAGTIPNAKISGDTVVCQRSFLNLSASGGDTYLWSDGSTGSLISVYANESKEYSVKVINANGCSSVAKIFVKVIPVPFTEAIKGDSLVKGAQKVTYTVPYHEGSFYKWTVTKGFIESGYGTNTITVLWNEGNSNGSLSVYETVNNDACNSNTMSKQVIIKGSIGLEEKAFKNANLNIFPNPSRGAVDISFSTDKNKVSLLIFNTFGQEIYKEELTSNNGQYNLHLDSEVFLSPGIYSIVIQSGNNKITKQLSITR